MTKKLKGIIVLGMHRSGTSLVSNLLHEFGFGFRGPHLKPQPDNPRGFWEHREIVRIHDDFLQHLGRIWSDPRPFRPDDFDGKTADWTRERLHEVFVRDFLSKPLWVLKDPRLCRFRPLWEPLLASESVTPGYLIVVRSPVAVARSLAQREGFSTHKSLFLWLRHYLEAESWTRGGRRIWVNLDNIRHHAFETIVNGLRRLDIDDRLVAAPEAAALDVIFDPGLIHHDGDGDLKGESWTASPWVDSTWEALRSLATDGTENEALGKIDDVRTSIRIADDLMMSDPNLWEVDALRDRANGVRYALASLLQLQQETKDIGTSILGRIQESEETAGGQFPRHGEALLRLETAQSLSETRIGAALSKIENVVISRESFLEDYAAAVQTVDRLRVERDSAKERLGAVLDSRIWKVTAPFRAILDRLKGR